MLRPLLPAVVAVAVVVVAGPPAVAAPDPAPRPVTWTSTTTPPPTDSTVTAELFRQVAVVPGGTAFAVGAVQRPFAGSASFQPLVERLDAGTWTRMTVPPYESGSRDESFAGVAGTAADDVWAVGHRVPTVAPSRRAPYAVHFDGTSWRSVAIPNPAPGVDTGVVAVAASAVDDVWAVGGAGSSAAAWHWDGSAWSGATVRIVGCRATSPVQLAAVTTTPTGEVFAGGACTAGDGTAVAVVARMERPDRWRVVARVGSRSGVEDIVADPAGTVWAVGTQRTDARTRPFLIAGSASTWTTRFRPVPADGGREQVTGVALDATGVTLVGETDTAARPRAPFAVSWTGARWRPVVVTAPGDGTGWLTAVDGSATGSVVAIGQWFGPRSVVAGFSASPYGALTRPTTCGP